MRRNGRDRDKHKRKITTKEHTQKGEKSKQTSTHRDYTCILTHRDYTYILTRRDYTYTYSLTEIIHAYSLIEIIHTYSLAEIIRIHTHQKKTSLGDRALATLAAVALSAANHNLNVTIFSTLILTGPLCLPFDDQLTLTGDV